MSSSNDRNEQIARLRAHHSVSDLAAMFGITTTQIYHILKQKRGQVVRGEMTEERAKGLMEEHIRWLHEQWPATAKRRTYGDEIEEAIRFLTALRKK